MYNSWDLYQSTGIMPCSVTWVLSYYSALKNGQHVSAPERQFSIDIRQWPQPRASLGCGWWAVGQAHSLAEWLVRQSLHRPQWGDSASLLSRITSDYMYFVDLKAPCLIGKTLSIKSGPEVASVSCFLSAFQGCSKGNRDQNCKAPRAS